jgi:hypothetical protein
MSDRSGTLKSFEILANLGWHLSVGCGFLESSLAGRALFCGGALLEPSFHFVEAVAG